MKTLGANTIRIYHVDPSADHKACMAAFADAGIYAFIDLDTFDTQINPVRRNTVMFGRLLTSLGYSCMDSRPIHTFPGRNGYFFSL
jgi:hypothetical protein